jgi:V/A-type H+-transporting ATPase subunit I
MAIVRMKRLRVIVPSKIQRKVLRDLTRLGCVEIENPVYTEMDEDMAQVIRPPSAITDAARARTDMVTALEALDKYAPSKRSFLTPRREINESVLFDEEAIEQAKEVSVRIGGLVRQINETKSLVGRITAQKASLEPWTTSDIPLEYTGGKEYAVIFGVVPIDEKPVDLSAILAESDLPAIADVIHSDNEQSYVVLVSYKDAQEDALTILKAEGFSQTLFKDMYGTAADNINRLDQETKTAEEKLQQLEAEIVTLAPHRDLLEQTIDALNVESLRETAMSSMLHTEKTTYFEGWTPEAAESTVAQVLEKNGCAYEFSEPAEIEEPPVVLKNAKLIQPFSTITEMYGLPAYRSLIDPNPIVAVSYFIFFGIMLSDALCGLVVSAVTFIILKKKKPAGMMKQFLTLFFFCGLSSLVWGALFGSWFGNAPSIVAMMLGKELVVPPVWFDPLAEPMKILVLSVVLGVVHLMLGMGCSAARQIKQGNIKEAIFDTGFWYMILIGGLGLFTGAKIFAVIAILGAVGVLLTAGREKKNIFSKLTSGLGALYGVTGYVSDILSYTRLMALGLCTGVIAMVMNTLGTLAGNSFIGWILFLIVFAIGHTFNVAVSTLGAFVHSMRLEFVEFFGKFYEAGGRPFKPLFNHTKYTEVIKEEI